MCYLAVAAEQARFVASVPRAYPRSWEVLGHEVQQGRVQMNAGQTAYPRFDAEAFMQQIPTNSEELRQCVNQQCPNAERT